MGFPPVEEEGHEERERQSDPANDDPPLGDDPSANPLRDQISHPDVPEFKLRIRLFPPLLESDPLLLKLGEDWPIDLGDYGDLDARKPDLPL